MVKTIGINNFGNFGDKITSVSGIEAIKSIVLSRLHVSLGEIGIIPLQGLFFENFISRDLNPDLLKENIFNTVLTTEHVVDIVKFSMKRIEESLTIDLEIKTDLGNISLTI
jgi:hypothetical protein